MKNTLSLLIVLGFVLLFASHGAAVVVVEDDFDDGVLDSAWSVLLEETIDWTYSESGTELTVTDIDPAVVNPINVAGTWARVMLNRTFASLSDFSIDFDFSWDSLNDQGVDDQAAVQAVYIRLYDASSNVMSEIGYWDLHAFGKGKTRIHVWENGVREHFIFNDPLPLSGSASVDVIRSGANIDFLWDDTLLMSTTEMAPLGGIDVVFQFYASERPTLFGTESVDLVRVEGTPTPPPPVQVDLDIKNLIIGTHKRTDRTFTKMFGEITSLPELSLSDGEAVKSRVTIELFGVTEGNGDLVISGDKPLNVRDVRRWFLLK